ncbi:hypothetical protein HELRODRAFT_64438, partial [Helobdella robusta]|uniref:tetrahydrofolate synthase n=1 Tax=Helobdella robusta TaxID=6412 RepID=T1FXU9_HELRO
QETIKTLNTLQSNASVIEDSKQKKIYYKSLIVMDEMCRRAKINIDDLDKLKIIHVSGTKGKGSTCAFSESILRYHGYKTGFYSSPHIVEVRERIRINGRPLAKDLFCNYFWDCYNNLNSTKADRNDAMPGYFRFLTIMAFHTFLQEKVDVAIVEVGIGGHYDCTNIIKNPSICAVTNLGLDHTNVLGSTIEEIAWNKAGIFKEYIPALTVPQNADAFKVLQERSIERKAPLIQCVPDERMTHVQLGIPGFMQAYNASLAVKICEMWMEDENKHLITNHPDSYITRLFEGLTNCNWPGRCQKVERGPVMYYLDGAHTEESIDVCTKWFLEEMDQGSKRDKRHKRSVRILLFNSTGDRQPCNLLKGLLKCRFDYAVFCPNIQRPPTSSDKSASLKSGFNSSIIIYCLSLLVISYYYSSLLFFILFVNVMHISR